MKALVRTLVAFAAVLFMLFPMQAMAGSLSDDAYHYPQFQDGQHDRNYVEWWYFNLSTENLNMMFSYNIANPDNYFGYGMATVGSIAYRSAGNTNVTEFFPTGDFSASTVKADVNVTETNRIEVIDADTYRIVGSVAENGNAISWDLEYTLEAAPWYAADQEKVGFFAWERMSWLVYMPRADVRGTVTINGTEHLIESATGYHDHNWGEWIPVNVLWNWGQYSEEGLNLEMGDFIRKPAGTVGIELDGERIVFEKDEYILLHTQWEYDDVNQKRFPVKSWLYAVNAEYRLLAVIEEEATEALRADIPLPIVDLIIYEQTAHYKGKLWKKNGRRWQKVRSFEGDGFKEYTTRKWE